MNFRIKTQKPAAVTFGDLPHGTLFTDSVEGGLFLKHHKDAPDGATIVVPYNSPVGYAKLIPAGRATSWTDSSPVVPVVGLIAYVQEGSMEDKP